MSVCICICYIWPISCKLNGGLSWSFTDEPAKKKRKCEQLWVVRDSKQRSPGCFVLCDCGTHRALPQKLDANSCCAFFRGVVLALRIWCNLSTKSWSFSSRRQNCLLVLQAFALELLWQLAKFALQNTKLLSKKCHTNDPSGTNEVQMRLCIHCASTRSASSAVSVPICPRAIAACLDQLIKFNIEPSGHPTGHGLNDIEWPIQTSHDFTGSSIIESICHTNCECRL